MAPYSYSATASHIHPSSDNSRHTECAVTELRDQINNNLTTGSSLNNQNDSAIVPTNTELSGYQPYRTQYGDPVGFLHMAAHIIGVSDAEEPINNIIGHETASLPNNQLSLSMLPRIHIAPGVLLP